MLSRTTFGSRWIFASRRLFSLKWNDAEDIAETLFNADKNLNPLTLRFTDLHHRICNLPDFSDDPQKSSESKLEAIQMSWFDLFEDSQKGEESKPR